MKCTRGVVPFLAFSVIFFFPAIGFATSLLLSWSANNERDLAGYKVYFGTNSRTYGSPIFVGKVTTCQLNSVLTGKTYYVALAAYDTSGNESPLSPEVSIYVPAQQAVAIVLQSPLKGAYLSSSPQFSWKGTGMTTYKVYVSQNSKDYTRIYSGSTVSCTMSSSFWNIFVPSGSILYWYVKGTTATGQVYTSAVSYFRKL